MLTEMNAHPLQVAADVLSGLRLGGLSRTWRSSGGVGGQQGLQHSLALVHHMDQLLLMDRRWVHQCSSMFCLWAEEGA